MNVDNPGELMEVLLENREARKFLGDFIEDAISKSGHVSLCLLALLHNNYQIKFAITHFVVILSSVYHAIESSSSSK